MRKHPELLAAVFRSVEKLEEASEAVRKSAEHANFVLGSHFKNSSEFLDPRI